MNQNKKTSSHFLTELVENDSDNDSFHGDDLKSYKSYKSILDDETIVTLGTKEYGLTKDECRKYFGTGGRIRFLKRFRWLNSQRDNAMTNNDNKSASLLFDNEIDSDDEKNDYPYSTSISTNLGGDSGDSVVSGLTGSLVGQLAIQSLAGT